MTRHNFLQKRARLLNMVRDAHTSVLWHLNATGAQERRSRTLAARRLAESTKNLHRLLTMEPR